MEFKLIGCEGVNWIKVAQDRVQCRSCVNTVTNVQVGSMKGGDFLDQLRDYQLLRKAVLHGVSPDGHNKVTVPTVRR
jgi:hypothetical protein